jgi:filamentous hemagglutinin
MNKKIKQVLSIIISSLLVFVPALSAADIEVDGTTNTTLDTAGNGVQIVNIANPNAQGLSHNKYTNYNVAQKGLILNNSKDTTVQTQLGGYIFGNSHLTSNAKVILNEVTSTNPSQLNGYIEVAGQRADLVIANPNGITVNGAGFINTANVTLSTGKPNIVNGEISSYGIQSGEIAIEGDGLDTTQTDSAYLYAKVLKLNAKIYANNLETEFGSLDASSLGGMYANAITLKGTDVGVGVNLPPEVLASNGDVSITANGDVVLNTVSASNDVTIRSTNLTNNNVIFSGNDITLHVADTLNNAQGANIFAMRNILIDGDEAGGVKTKTVNNNIANIQSINGDISIYANQLNNVGEATLDYEIFYKDVLKGTTSIDYTDLVWLSIAYNTHGNYENDPYGAIMEWRRNIATRMQSKVPEIDSSVYANKNNFDFSAIEKYYVSNPVMNFAKIQANNNINLFIDDGLNKDAYIYAGKNLNLDVQNTLKVTATNENVGSSGYKYIVQAIPITYGCDGGDTCWAFYTNSGYRANSDDLTVYADSLVSAGENVSQINGSLEVDGSTDENVVTSLNAEYQPQIDDNGLFVLSEDPSSNYLIETNPLFANLNNFLSSSYLLDRLGYDSEKQAKMLGDGLYEQRLVQDQILQQTGRTFLDPQYTTNQAIYQNLLDNAFQAQQDLELSVGVSLTKEQINALTEDIVWMEEKEVMGTKVLVPVVYLANQHNYKISGGSIVAGDKLSLEVDQLTNSGNIQAGSRIAVQSNTITNKKDIKTDGTLELIAKNDINNLSGTIQGGETYVESLEGNVNNETLSQDVNYKVGIYNVGDTQVAKTATISSTNGDTTLKAKGDISNIGSQIKATNGDVVVTTTNGDVNFKALETKKSANAVFDGGYYRSQQTDYKTSSIEGDNVALTSGNDVNLEATKVNAVNNIAIDATNNTNITSLKSVNSTDAQYTSSTTGLIKKTSVTRMTSRDEDVVASELNGKNITINTGDTTTIQAANIKAEEDLNVQSKELNILAEKNSNYTETDSSGSGLLSSSSSTDIKLTEKVQGTTIEANNFNVNTIDDINLESVNINANNAVNMKSDRGNVNLSAKAYTNAEYHESTSSSFGGLVGSHSIDALSQTKLGNSATVAQNSINVGGQNINLIANDLNAKNGTIKLQADENINIASGKESSSEQHLRESTGISLGLDGGKFTYAEVTKDSTTNTKITNKASNINANNLILESQGDANIIASNVNANSMEVDVANNFNVLADQNVNINNEEHSKKELGFELKLNSKEASLFAGTWENTNGQTTTQKDVAKSTLNTSTLNIQVQNANIVGSDILANDMQIDTQNTKVLSATASTDTKTYTKSIKAGVSVGVTQNISDTIDKVKSVGDASSGTGTASRTLKAYDAANSFLQKPVDAGVYAIYEETQKTTNQHSEQAVASNLYAGNNAALHSNENLEVGGSNIYANNNLELSAKDINLHSTSANYSSSTDASSKNAKGSLYGSDAGTVTLGLQDSAENTQAATQANTYIEAGNKATLTSTQDTTLKGTVVDANKLEVNVGRDLVMQSMQNTQTIKGESKGGSISGNVLTMTPTGASANYGTTSGDKQWVNEVTALNGKDSIVVNVNDTTTLKGASITNKDATGVDQGNLQLTTNELKTEDILDHDNYKSTNIGISVGSVDSDPSLNSIDFANNTKDKEQIVRATVGQGSITTNSDTTNLNRDITKTKEITKDESSNIELYVSDSSLDALSDPTQAYNNMKQRAKDLGLAAHKEIQEDLPSVSKRIGDSKKVEDKELNEKVNDFIDDTVGTLVDLGGKVTYGILPSIKNDGGYVTQIAIQLFGDNREMIVANDTTQFEKWNLKAKDPKNPNNDWDYESYTTPEGKTQYRTNPDKAVRIDEQINVNDPLNDYKIHLTSQDLKDAKINTIFTNGLNNTAEEAINNQQGQQANPSIGLVNYNTSHGTLADLLIETTMEKSTIALDAIPGVQELGYVINGSARQTGDSINQLAKINDGDINIAAHSQGTQQTYLGLQQHKEEIAQLLKENPNAKLTLQNSGSPVSSEAVEDLIVNGLYGGESSINERFNNEEGVNNVFRSQVNPGDPVAMLGGNFGGINNNAPITSGDFWNQIGYTLTRGVPTIFRGSLQNNLDDPSKTSPHSGYPCVIGCGDNGFTPANGTYYDITNQNNQVPLQDFYIKLHLEPSQSNIYTPTASEENR